jgi:hypothetical protein
MHRRSAPPPSSAWRILLPVCLGAVLLCGLSIYGIVRLLPGRQPKPEPAPNATPTPERTAPVVTAPPPAPASTLPPELQEKVNRAIENGLTRLRKGQKPTGTWLDQYPIALAALPGLTLLECGVPATDEGVRKAAKFVRDRVESMSEEHRTYTYSLAILFLDRLGDDADRPLIHTLALRLIAGQRPDGGWTYNVPKVEFRNHERLMLALTLTRPRELEGLIKAVEKPGVMEGIKRGEGKPEDAARKAVAELPEPLQKLPSFAGEEPWGGGGDATDNSNTQFAGLALWASLRHGVPAEAALRRFALRFRNTQRGDGRWNYHPHSGMPAFASPAMTGVGLLGLGIGHGLNTDPDRKPLDDEQVKKGMKELGGLMDAADAQNLYFLWTLERVGVLYNVRQIGGKDWYRHAVDILLERQQWHGGWDMHGYYEANGTIDTCLALLILKRANFAEELTRHLEGGLIKSR